MKKRNIKEIITIDDVKEEEKPTKLTKLESVVKASTHSRFPQHPGNKWLFKSEPDARLVNGVDVSFPITKLEEVKVSGWDGVRNYQARNNMRSMKVGDLAFFYHSSCKVPGIVGLCRVVKEAYLDESALDPLDAHYDPKCTASKCPWERVDVEFVQKFTPQENSKLSLPSIKKMEEMQSMSLFTSARLSVQPVKQRFPFNIVEFASKLAYLNNDDSDEDEIVVREEEMDKGLSKIAEELEKESSIESLLFNREIPQAIFPSPAYHGAVLLEGEGYSPLFGSPHGIRPPPPPPTSSGFSFGGMFRNPPTLFGSTLPASGLSKPILPSSTSGLSTSGLSGLSDLSKPTAPSLFSTKPTPLSSMSMPPPLQNEDKTEGKRTYRSKGVSLKPTDYKRKIDSNVIQLKLGTLSDEGTLATGDAVFCVKCGVAYSLLSNKLNKETSLWNCEFCSTENVINLLDGELPTNDVMDYLIELPPLTLEGKKSGADDNIILFVVDTSGSMCVSSEISGRHELLKNDTNDKVIEGISLAEMREGRNRRNTTFISRLEAIQRAILQQVEDLKKNHPNYRVGLLTFNGSVTLIGDGSTEARVISGDRLDNHADLVSIADAYPLTTPIKDSIETFKSKLTNLETQGATALGPAIVSAISLASKKSGSKVIVCTDGIANVGLGSLELSKTSDEERLKCSSFYSSISNWAKDYGVIIDVIGIEGDCDLEQLGVMSDNTGGDVVKVNTATIVSNTAKLTVETPIATKVTATLFLHKGLKFRAIPGTDIAQDLVLNKVVKEIGNVVKSTEVTFEYDIIKSLFNSSLEKLPFQVQITFTRLDGARCTRIISKSQPVTSNRDEAIKACNMEIISSHAQATFSAKTIEGDYKAGRSIALGYSHWMEEGSTSREQKLSHQTYLNRNSLLDQTIRGEILKEGMDMDTLTSEKRKEERSKARSKNDSFSSNLFMSKKGGNY